MFISASAGRYSNQPQAMDNYRFWSMGALNSMSLTEAGWLIPYLLVAISLTFSLSAALNIMVFGDGIVHSLGGNVARTRLLALLSVSMLAAVANRNGRSNCFYRFGRAPFNAHLDRQ